MIHSTIRGSKLTVVLSACFVLLTRPSIPLPAAQPTSGNRAIKIAVLVQHSDGRPISGLASRDFEVNLQGQTLPFTLSRPVLGNKVSTGDFLPTRMLIILPKAPGDSAAAMPSDLMPALGPVWQRGWQVAVAQYNGRATDFANSALQLEQMWHAQIVKSTNSKGIIQHLRFFKGRRIVLFVTEIHGPNRMPPDWIVHAASRSMAELFVVNGGVQVDAPNMLNAPGFGGGSGREIIAESVPFPIPDSAPTSERAGHFEFGPGEYRGLYQEADARKAIQDALHDAVGYYSLQIASPPAGSIPSGANVSLKMNLKNASKLLITAKAYSGDKVLELTVITK
jgi:hypothetical protein